MASVKDLERVFNAEPRLTPGQVRMVTRLLQDGGILPKVKQGKGRGPLPQITPEHCAAWLVGLAVTRRSGTRNVKDAVERVERVMGLVNRRGKEVTFGWVLTWYIEQYANDDWREDLLAHRFLIINDETEPSVEFTVCHYKRNGEVDKFDDFLFVDPEKWEEKEKYIPGEAPPLEFTEFADAFVIGGEVLLNFREVFAVDDDEDAA